MYLLCIYAWIPNLSIAFSQKISVPTPKPVEKQQKARFFGTHPGLGTGVIRQNPYRVSLRRLLQEDLPASRFQHRPPRSPPTAGKCLPNPTLGFYGESLCPQVITVTDGPARFFGTHPRVLNRRKQREQRCKHVCHEGNPVDSMIRVHPWLKSVKFVQFVS
jgi:hypothetical protein